MSDDYDGLSPDELRDLVRARDKRLREERESNEQTTAWAAAVAEHNKECGEQIERWIETFEMQQNEDGVWIFDPGQTALWEEHDRLREEHRKLIRDWNRFVPLYNAMIAERPQRAPGRPLHASEAQAVEVLKLRAKGGSLRGIAAATNLSFSTVCSIVNRLKRQDTQQRELRRQAFNKEAAARYRARKRSREQLEKSINATGKAIAANRREARRLGLLKD